MKSYIYALTDPRDERCYYVGQTVNPMARLSGHKGDKSGKAKIEWIARLRTVGLAPKMVVLEEVAEELATEREQWWIDELRQRGEPLTNHKRACRHGWTGVPPERRHFPTAHRRKWSVDKTSDGGACPECQTGRLRLVTCEEEKRTRQGWACFKCKYMDMKTVWRKQA